MVLAGGMFVAAVHSYSPPAAWLVGILLLGAWAAPILAVQSMIPPRRATASAPAPGAGTYDEWRKQARLIGRMVIYYEENRGIPPDLRGALGRATRDLRDTLGAHPLRDDLERVCRRVRAGAIQDVKDWLWRNNRRYVQELRHQYERELETAADEDERLVRLQGAVEDAAAEMTRQCMPRMLERERLICARDCAWLASQTAHGIAGGLSPIDLAAALVVEWSDFSEPWQPARMLHRAAVRVQQPIPAEEAMPLASPEAADSAAAAAGPASEKLVFRNGKKYRRVRVRRKNRRHRSRSRGPSMVDVFLSFGQWLRYSIRSWLLYR